MTVVGQAVDLWVRAYEVAGVRGGGPPDANLLAQAQSLALTPRQQGEIRQLAISIVTLVLGPTVYGDSLSHLRGHFLPPTSDDDGGPFPEGDNGVVEQLDSSLCAAVASIRAGMVEELQSPNQGLLESRMGQILQVDPNFKTYQRCEYPHPADHDHPFPYANGIACLTAEMRRIADVLIASQRGLADPGVPGTTPVGTTALVLAMLVTGLLVARRSILGRA
jgi:hypothetical protein